MQRVNGKTCIITGAAVGIGRACALRLAQEGARVALFDILDGEGHALESELRAAGHEVAYWHVDVADEAMVRTAVDEVAARFDGVHVLVNNAGVLEHGPFIGMPAARHQQLIDLNISGLTALLAQFLPGMVARGSGRVLNVASIASFQPVPSLATYAATKAYVLSLTESLSEELKGTGVTITALCPGITATHMLEAASTASAELQRLPAFLVGDADDVADQGFAACMAGTVICVPGAINRATVTAGRATPKWLLRRISGGLVRRLKSS